MPSPMEAMDSSEALRRRELTLGTSGGGGAGWLGAWEVGWLEVLAFGFMGVSVVALWFFFGGSGLCFCVCCVEVSLELGGVFQYIFFPLKEWVVRGWVEVLAGFAFWGEWVLCGLL